jgi:spermidine/putrescine transport system ATP-binding protein
VLVGIRPEKISIRPESTSASGSVLQGGVVSDVSYMGVSTQYVVEMPWKQDITVFEQNDGGVPTIEVGDKVTLSWEPHFTFGLDGTEDAQAGARTDQE